MNFKIVNNCTKIIYLQSKDSNESHNIINNHNAEENSRSCLDIQKEERSMTNEKGKVLRNLMNLSKLIRTSAMRKLAFTAIIIYGLNATFFYGILFDASNFAK